MSEEVDNQQIKDAWDRIARSRDGLVVYRHLQRIRLGLATDQSALPAFEGRRSLAADLMAFMSEGIAENDRAACVTFAVAKPVAITGTGTDARRKWLASQSWYDDSGASGAGGSPGTGINGSGGTAAD